MRHIAFLRAINVGAHVVKMDRLRLIFEAMAFSHVETFIASGNVIFDSTSSDAAALEARIERNLKKALGYDVGTFIRSCAEVSAIAARDPFDSPTDCSLYVVFLKTAADRALRKRLAELCSDVDAFHAHQRELYWQSRASISQSAAAVPFGKAFGTGGTMRNVTTVRKLAAKYGSR
jgi:uncharacterized protein (DUF1697 family)